MSCAFPTTPGALVSPQSGAERTREAGVLSRRWVRGMIGRAVGVVAGRDKCSRPILTLGKPPSHSYSSIPKTFRNSDVTSAFSPPRLCPTS